MPHNEKIPICVINHKGELLSYYRSINECITMNNFPESSVYHAVRKRRIYRCMLFIRESEYREHWESRTTHLLAFKTKKERNKDKAENMLRARRNPEVEQRRRQRISESCKRRAEQGLPMNFAKAAADRRKPVMCLDTGITYESLKELSIQTGIKASTISKGIKRKTKVKGMRYQYIEDIKR